MTDHLCDELCEAAGLGLPRCAPFKGLTLHMLVCTVHERCLIVEESDNHYQRLTSGRANCEAAITRLLDAMVLVPSDTEKER